MYELCWTLVTSGCHDMTNAYESEQISPWMGLEVNTATLYPPANASAVTIDLWVRSCEVLHKSLLAKF